MPEDPAEDAAEDEDEAANTAEAAEFGEVIRRVTSALWSSSLRWCASSSA